MFSRYFPGVQTSCPSFGAVTPVESRYVEIDCLFLVEMTMDRGVPLPFQTNQLEKTPKMVRENPITFIFPIFQVAIHLGVYPVDKFAVFFFSHFITSAKCSPWVGQCDKAWLIWTPFWGMALNMKVS